MFTRLSTKKRQGRKYYENGRNINGSQQKAVSSNSCIPHEEEKISTPGPVEIGSPLTPVDHLPLSTPKEPTSC